MKSPFFPITMRELSAKMDINKLNEMKFSLGKLDIHAALVNHPGVCAGYRIFTSGGSVAFLPDHEPYEFFLHVARGKQLVRNKREKWRRPSMLRWFNFCAAAMF